MLARRLGDQVAVDARRGLNGTRAGHQGFLDRGSGTASGVAMRRLRRNGYAMWRNNFPGATASVITGVPAPRAS